MSGCCTKCEETWRPGPVRVDVRSRERYRVYRCLRCGNVIEKTVRMPRLRGANAR
jgi:uncharacterized Zn finger protein